jgi:predicted nucleotidyltransferase
MKEKPDIAITDAEWSIVKDILQKFLPKETVWAFGSRVRHTHKPFSDLDIVVVNDQPLSIATMAELREAFSESDLPWKVDVVDWDSISDSFKDTIKSNKLELQ